MSKFYKWFKEWFLELKEIPRSGPSLENKSGEKNYLESETTILGKPSTRINENYDHIETSLKLNKSYDPNEIRIIKPIRSEHD